MEGGLACAHHFQLTVSERLGLAGIPTYSKSLAKAPLTGPVDGSVSGARTGGRLLAYLSLRTTPSASGGAMESWNGVLK